MLCLVVAILSLLLCSTSFAQSQYKVINVTDGGTITGVVKWSGSEPRDLTFPITKDAQICDPDSHKHADLQRLGASYGVMKLVTDAPHWSIDGH